jgi:precorrin-6B methylase 2
VSLYQVKAYVRHWLNEVDEHSIHSPFFYDFFTKVLRGTTPENQFSALEQLRTNLLNNHTVVVVDDFGGGSALPGNRRMLADIARTSVTPRPYAEFYFRILESIRAKRIVELGSCLGVTSLYLAQKKGSSVFTFEGSPSLINVSLTNFEYFNQPNIRLMEGNIESSLPDFLQDPAKIDFTLIDANHRYAPTLKYFNLIMKRLDEKSIVVIDDIHRSEEMEQAWKELSVHELVYGSIDLFQCGILLFEPSLNRQHYVWSLK